MKESCCDPFHLLGDMQILDIRPAEDDIVIHVIAWRDLGTVLLSPFRAEGAN